MVENGGQPLQKWQNSMLSPQFPKKSRKGPPWPRVLLHRKIIQSLISFQHRGLKLIVAGGDQIAVTNAQVHPGDKVCQVDHCDITHVAQAPTQNGPRYQLIRCAYVTGDINSMQNKVQVMEMI